MTSYWQGDSRWGKETIGVDAKMAASGCVVTTLTNLVNLLTNKKLTPLEVLQKLNGTPGVFVDASGSKPGNLMVWPKALALYGLACDEAIASGTDHGDALHEFAGHLVDADADLAGALAGAMVGGAAAVRVDINGDGLGDHTIACVRRDGNLFVCDCSALAKLIELDENLENATIKWGSTPHPYRAVGIRAVYLPDPA